LHLCLNVVHAPASGIIQNLPFTGKAPDIWGDAFFPIFWCVLNDYHAILPFQPGNNKTLVFHLLNAFLQRSTAFLMISLN
jgi:hypothetical protein